VVRDQSRGDADRAEAAQGHPGLTVAPQAPATFAHEARKRMRNGTGGCRRDHLRALAQWIEVDDGEVRIVGRKRALLCALVASGGEKGAGICVPSFVPKWRARRDPSSGRCHPRATKTARARRLQF
jgi:hypothetical protein